MTVDDGNFVLHGAVLYMKSDTELFETEDGYLVCMDGVSAGVFEELPEEFAGWPLIDCWENLIVPGFIDTLSDARLANLRGLGTYLSDEEFSEKYAEPEALKLAADRQYETRSFDAFIETIFIGPATRAVVNAGTDFAAAASTFLGRPIHGRVEEVPVMEVTPHGRRAGAFRCRKVPEANEAQKACECEAGAPRGPRQNVPGAQGEDKPSCRGGGRSLS